MGGAWRRVASTAARPSFHPSGPQRPNLLGAWSEEFPLQSADDERHGMRAGHFPGGNKAPGPMPTPAESPAGNEPMNRQSKFPRFHGLLRQRRSQESQHVLGQWGRCRAAWSLVALEIGWEPGKPGSQEARKSSSVQACKCSAPSIQHPASSIQHPASIPNQAIEAIPSQPASQSHCSCPLPLPLPPLPADTSSVLFLPEYSTLLPTSIRPSILVVDTSGRQVERPAKGHRQPRRRSNGSRPRDPTARSLCVPNTGPAVASDPHFSPVLVLKEFDTASPTARTNYPRIDKAPPRSWDL
jgi:hypothetical protein